MYASSGNKHFFTKSCHRQTYQNYEQPPRTSQNSYFQSHFSVLKICRIFPPKKFYKEYLTRRPTFINLPAICKRLWKCIHNPCNKFWRLHLLIFVVLFLSGSGHDDISQNQVLQILILQIRLFYGNSNSVRLDLLRLLN